MNLNENNSKKQTPEEMLSVIMQWNEKISASLVWYEYVSSIKNVNRSIPPLKFQDYIKMLLDFKEIIPDDLIFYRARLIKPSLYNYMKIINGDNTTRGSGIFGLQKEEMQAPPNEMARAGRANPEGISYLYISNNQQTACSEIRPVLTEMISVSRFKLVKKLTVINLINADLKAYDGIEKIRRYSFLNEVMMSFAAPINEQNDLEYAPTQYIAAYLKANDIDGIKYVSHNNFEPQSYNIVLFNPDNAECIDEYGKVYRCVKKQMAFQDISTYEKKIFSAENDIDYLNEEEIKELNIRLGNYINTKKA